MNEGNQLSREVICEHIKTIAKFSIHPETELQDIIYKELCFGEIFFNIEGRAQAYLYDKCLCTLEFRFQLTSEDKKCGFDDPCPITVKMGDEFRLRSCNGHLEPCSLDELTRMNQAQRTFQA